MLANAGRADTTARPPRAPATPSPVEEPGEPRPPVARRRSLAAVVIVISIASLPMLMPAGLPPGPGNTGLPDLFLVVLLFTTVMWAAQAGHRVHLPFLVPTLLAVLAGAAATMVVNEGQITLLKDVFVLFWAVAFANMGRDPRLLETALKAWCYIGTGYAAIFVLGYLAGIDAVIGAAAEDDARGSFTFGDANYASNYFITVLCVVIAARRPRHRGRRFGCYAILLTAEILTGSNGGMLALVTVLAIGWFARKIIQGRSLRALGALAAVAALVVTGMATIDQSDVDGFLARASTYSPILRDSIGRADSSSTATRGQVLDETTKMLGEQEHPWGIGPARTENELRLQLAPYVREAHNDYIASVLERGFLGGLATIVLIVVLMVKSVRIARRGALRPEYDRLVPRPELLGAMVVAMLVSAMFYETLHYRHGWALFGLIAALEIFGRRGEREQRKEGDSG